MAESWAPVPDPDPKSISEAMPALSLSLLLSLGSRQPLSVTLSLSLTLTWKKWMRANKATKPISKRVEITIKAPAILPRPIIIKYTQPNTSKKYYTILENLLSKATTLLYY
ncbi:hypothetical protein IFM47457_11197 [Aspergillus lentulus]|nr:hypothetical protein IFM47457_11197 [Aspergillus lentulus]